MICLIPKYFLSHAHIGSTNTEKDPDESQSATGEFEDSVEIEINSLMTDIGGRIRDVTRNSQHLHIISTLRNELVLKLYRSEPPLDMQTSGDFQ